MALSAAASTSSSLLSSSPSFAPRSSGQSAFLFSPLKSVYLQASHGRHVKQITRCAVSVRSEVKYVDGVEAKKLVTEEGYTVLDIRDRIQYEKAHIVPSTHVPVYIENTDNDISNMLA